MRVKLEDAVTRSKTVEVTVRSALYATKCDGCGKLFEMKEFCNESGRAALAGTFDRSVEDSVTGKGMGNGFHASICSLLCAHRIFAEGGWKLLDEYAPFVKAGATLARAYVTVTSYVLGEKELREAWAAEPSEERKL